MENTPWAVHSWESVSSPALVLIKKDAQDSDMWTQRGKLTTKMLVNNWASTPSRWEARIFDAYQVIPISTKLEMMRIGWFCCICKVFVLHVWGPTFNFYFRKEIKSQSWWCMLIILVPGKWRQEDTFVSLGSQPSLVSELQALRRNPISMKNDRCDLYLRKKTWVYHLASTCMSVHMCDSRAHARTDVHTHLHTKWTEWLFFKAEDVNLGVCVLCVGEMQGGLEGMWGMNVFIFYIYTKEILKKCIFNGKNFLKKNCQMIFFLKLKQTQL